MPRIMRDGEWVDCTSLELVARLRELADWANEKFAIHSDGTAFIGDHLHQAADEIERLSK